MFDWSILFYLFTFLATFALQIGWVDFSSSADAVDGEDDAPDYDPANYGSVEFGSDGDDDISAEPEQSDIAYEMGAGDDILFATDGNDYADGGDGADILSMGDGNDIVVGGAGDDHLLGGEGDDQIFGQSGDDIIQGHGGRDLLYGGSGNDSIEGGYGDDTLFGGSGDDHLSGDRLVDPSNMGRGIDVLDGGAGNDNLFLGDGDTGTGGDGADTFTVFEIVSPDAPAAHVTDFNATEDNLHVQYYAVTDLGTGAIVPPTLDVSYDVDADLTTVSLNGSALVTLAGDAGITVDDITLTIL